MTKTYEELLADVEIEEFVEAAGVDEAFVKPKPREKIYKPILDESIRTKGVVPKTESSFKKVNLDFTKGLLNARTDYIILKEQVNLRGEFVEISTPEENFEEAVLRHDIELNNMWYTIGNKFGNQLEFEGNPFSKASAALQFNAKGQEFNTKVQEWLKQAEEIFATTMRQNLSDVEEIVEEVEVLEQNTN